MTTKEKLLQAIETTPEPVLVFILAILEFLCKPINQPHLATLNTIISSPASIPGQDAQPILRGSKAKDLIQFAGTWEGDDFEDCLGLVYQTRSQIEA